MTAIAAGGMKGQSQPTYDAIVASPAHRPNEEDEQTIRSEQVNNNQKRAAVVGRWWWGDAAFGVCCFFKIKITDW